MVQAQKGQAHGMHGGHPQHSQQQRTAQAAMPLVQQAQINSDILPDNEYRECLEAHQPKFDIEVLRQLLKEVGLSTPDDRVYKMISVMLEKKMSEIVSEVQAMQAQSQKEKEPISVHAKI